MASSSGGFQATDESREVEMEIVEPEPEPEPVGSKRARDPLDGMDPHGTSKIRDHCQHGTHGDRTLPDFNTRSSIASGKNLGNKIKRPTNNQGWCDKGNSRTFLHEREGPGSYYQWNNDDKNGLLAADAYGNFRGSEGSQFKDSDGLAKNRSLIRMYGGADKSLHGAAKQGTFTLGVSQGMPSRFDDTLTKQLSTPINELVPSLYGKNRELSLGCHSGLTTEIYVNSRGTFPRSRDGGIFQSATDKRTYIDLNYLDSKLQHQSFDLSIPSDSIQRNEKLSAYSVTAGKFPNTHNKEHLSSHSPCSSYSLPDFKNPLHATSDHSFGKQTLFPTSHLGGLSQHVSPSVIEKVGPHKYVDVGTGTSRPPLFASSLPEPSIVSPGPLSPIKDEVWVTSVPFVPSFDFPDIKPPKKQYDPLVDYIDSPKAGTKDNLKTSGISIQHTHPDVVTPKSLDHDGNLARNMSAKGSKEVKYWIASDKGHSSGLHDNNRVKVDDRKPDASAKGSKEVKYWIASDKGHSCGLHDNNRVKVDDRKPDAASNSEKTRNFRFCLADHIKELIEKDWLEGYLTKDAYKLIVKKSIDKILSSIEPHQVPTSEGAIANYIALSKSKIKSLVKAYVDRYHA